MSSDARFSRIKVSNPFGSGKDIAEGKGVHRRVASEGNWMWGTTTPRTNLWSDKQKSHRMFRISKSATQDEAQ